MKKRLFSLLLVLCMMMTLLPFGVLASRTANSDACFRHLRDYARSNGTLTLSGYTCEKAVENGTVALTYSSVSDELRLKYTAEQDGATYVVELTIPSSVQMPYDATQTMTKGLIVRNNAKIPDGFTTQT